MKVKVGRSLTYSGAILLALFCLVPILWGIGTSLKLDEHLYDSPPQWIPWPITFENYIAVLNNKSILQGFTNSVVVATVCTVMSLVIGILGAYGFSRYKFPGRSSALAFILLTQLFPRVVLIVPLFVSLMFFNLMNTYAGLVITYLLATLPIAIWLLKGFFDAIPIEVEEAALIDGCSTFRLLTSIVLPLTRPALMAVGMYAFILAWNEYLFAFVFTSGAERRPVSVVLGFFIDEQGVHWGELTAASLLMALPAVIVFMFAQKHLVRGLSEGAVKG